MRHQRQPTGWSCLATSFAMALDLPVSALMDLVGHDGSEIVWPSLADPICRRGHHPQEMVLAAHGLGFSVTPFEAYPSSIGAPGVEPFLVPMRGEADDRMRAIMSDATGVLTGTDWKGRRHAVAWDGRRMLDPAQGRDFSIETFWLVRKIKSA